MDREGEETPFEVLSDDEQQLLEVFIEYNVHAVVVGGYAVRVHGHLREVGDPDLVIQTTQENLDRLQQALFMLGVTSAAQVTLLLGTCSKAKWRWRDGYLDHYVDLLSTLGSFNFADLVARALDVNYEGMNLKAMSTEQLIEAKRAAVSDPARAAAIARLQHSRGSISRKRGSSWMKALAPKSLPSSAALGGRLDTLQTPGAGATWTTRTSTVIVGGEDPAVTPRGESLAGLPRTVYLLPRNSCATSPMPRRPKSCPGAVFPAS